MKRNSVCASWFFLLVFSRNTPLLNSAYGGHLDVCRLLLQYNADVEAKTIKCLLPPLYFPSLLLICGTLSVPEVILLLLFSQATPLTRSAEEGHLEVCRLLLQCNADVEAKNVKYLPVPLLMFSCFYDTKLFFLKLILYFFSVKTLHCFGPLTMGTLKFVVFCCSATLM